MHDEQPPYRNFSRACTKNHRKAAGQNKVKLRKAKRHNKRRVGHHSKGQARRKH